MLHANVSGIKDPMKQDQALEFWRKQNKDINTRTGTHANHDQLHQIRSDRLGPIFFPPGDFLDPFFFSPGEKTLFLFHPGLEGVTDVDTNLNGRFVSFKVTLSNYRVLYMVLQDTATGLSWTGDIF